MRTQEEIVEKIRSDKSFLGFGSDALFPYLDFDHAKEFLKKEVTTESWDGSRIKNPTDELIKREMADYMAFAWEKVEDHRSISANRSVDKMEAWAWLLGRDDIVKAIKKAPYENYGAPKLAVVCRMLDLPIPEEKSIQNMIRSLPCCVGCYMGCGR